LIVSRRTVLRTLAASLLAAPAILSGRPARAQVEADAGQLLILGFASKSARGASARALARQLAAGRAAGVMFLGHNIGTRADVLGLTALFRAEGDPLLAIDQEGGRVQRLSPEQGFTAIPRPAVVAGELTPSEARAVYARAGRELREAGFNLNLAPVVDLFDPENPVIGQNGRSFAADPEVVTRYAEACVDGYASAGVHTALKHFPGHGFSRGDSHEGPVNITRTWQGAEVIPFQRLIAAGKAEAIMAGHLVNGQLSNDGLPATLSRQMIEGYLRGQLGFGGVVISDDLDMDAVRAVATLRGAVIGALKAGLDLLILSNSLAPDRDLAADAVGWIAAAVNSGELPAARVAEAAGRVRRMKAR
jgi:beta-N-acetylhexosaminidase